MSFSTVKKKKKKKKIAGETRFQLFPVRIKSMFS